MAAWPWADGSEEVDRLLRVHTVQTVALFTTKATGSHLLDINTAMLYTKQDFNYKLEAVRGLVQWMKAKFIRGSGHVARIYYYYVGHCVAQCV